jgi:nucleoside 2-deoxyribosyltransferase
MKLVYISCPITLGNKNHNWFQAAEAQVVLMRAGYAVHNPAHAMMLPESSNISWEDWLRMDEAIIDHCDMVVLLPGESKGADRECEYAKSKGIPVMALSEALLEGYFEFEARISALEADVAAWKEEAA